MRFELFFKTSAELSLLLRNTKCLDIKPYKFNLPNKIKNERKDLLKSASIIQDEFGKGVENLDICIHYSMKNNKSKSVEESLDMITSFLQQSNSPENTIREILLC